MDASSILVERVKLGVSEFVAGISENSNSSTGCAEDFGDTFSSLSNCFSRGQLFWPVFIRITVFKQLFCTIYFLVKI